MKIRYLIVWALVLFLIAFYNGRIGFPKPAQLLHADRGPRGANALRVTKYDEKIQQEMDLVVARLKRALSDTHPPSLDCFGEPVTDEQIAELESQFGYELPGQLKAFLKIHGPPNKTTADGLAGSSWSFYGTKWIHQWSMESTHWVSAEGGVPRVPETHNGWGPGFVMFMGNTYEFLGIYLENGKVYQLDPESGYAEHAASLADWFNNISDRLENGQYSKNGGDFELTPPSGEYMSTPGQTFK